MPVRLHAGAEQEVAAMDQHGAGGRINQELERLRKQVEEQGHQFEERLRASIELPLRSEQLRSHHSHPGPPDEASTADNPPANDRP